MASMGPIVPHYGVKHFGTKTLVGVEIWDYSPLVTQIISILADRIGLWQGCQGPIGTSSKPAHQRPCRAQAYAAAELFKCPY